MTRRAAILALTLSLGFLIVGGMSGVYTQEGHFAWEQVQP